MALIFKIRSFYLNVYLGMSLDSELRGNWSQPGVYNILDLSNTLLLEDKEGWRTI